MGIIPEETGFLDALGVSYDLRTPADQLETILLKNFGENGINWKGMKEDLRASPCSADEMVRTFLVQADGSSRKYEQKLHSNYYAGVNRRVLMCLYTLAPF